MEKKDIRMIYEKEKFDLPGIVLETYKDDYFRMELDLESDVFYELRVSNGWQPYRINESSPEELKKIGLFFGQNRDTFYFLFKDRELIGSTLHLKNYIQSLCVAGKFQHKGYGTLLTKYAVNKILEKGFNTVELNVFPDNYKAINLYMKLGFRVIV
ncbi:MAG: GNAT family N-acetyltransferase [Spirochaetales bacterium]|nr:GNAT family N-acetyltransferase [Spirochaetales bacterium]